MTPPEGDDRPRPKGYVVSDLHLYSRRSEGERVRPELEAAADRAEVFVLNGDIFDFRWTTLPSVAETVEAAAGWLEGFVGRRPGCRFYYVLGNHDCLVPFVERLDGLAEALPNLEWSPTHLRLGSSLFLHGDLALARRRGGEGAGPFERELLADEGRKGEFLHRCYEALVALRAHRAVHLTHGGRRCARRIARALEASGHEAVEGVTDVYFGHTHVPMTDFKHAGVTFHNTGSAIRNMAFNMLALEVPGEGGGGGQVPGERAKGK